MNTYVVTVTYGCRHEFVEKLAEQLFAMEVFALVVVDNGSVVQSRQHLEKLAARYPSKFKLILHEQNLGSAGGFKAGLMFAHRQSDCDFIWMLDDDNLPEQNALIALVETYNRLDENCCLVSLRTKRVPYRKVFNDTDVRRRFRPHNSFVDFNIIHGIGKKMLFNLKGEKHDVVKIPYGPYGGMFFHKRMLDVIGFPNEKMYLYLDDHEFSHRIVKTNRNIYLVRTSKVDDVEASWHAVKKHRFFKRFMLLIDGDETKSYFTMRNLMFLERKYYVDSKLLYALNEFVFKIIYYTLCWVLKRNDRIALFKKAYVDSITLSEQDRKPETIAA